MTATPTAICSADFGRRAQHEHAAQRPGHRGDEDRADLAPRHARAPALAEEHEPVEREPEHGDRDDRALGLEQREAPPG